MLVQMQWERVLRSPNYITAIAFMLENRVLGIEETFHFTDRESNFDPIFGRTVVQGRCFDPSIAQPIVNKFQCLVGGFNKLVDLIVSQMLAITDVVRVRNYSFVKFYIEIPLVGSQIPS
jgi:hypothetical protein